MKVLSLISGGKDSIFHMMECARYGHELVAVANLEPSDSSVEDLDSWCFQTVGHGAIEAIAECLELPLFRSKIRGGLVNSQLAYIESKDDEVEDLYELLLKAKTAMPEIEAVGSGAILSTYQRTRVENVCQRLGLTSLAYLWQRDQVELLDEMISSGMEAILIKVAAMGLSPAKHLGKTITELQPHLLQIATKFGCNPCGEGGEYESFTLDCPLFLRKRIVIVKSELCGDLKTDIAPVGNLRLLEWRFEPKPSASSSSSSSTSTVHQRQPLVGREEVLPAAALHVVDKTALEYVEKQREYCAVLGASLDKQARGSCRAANFSGDLAFVAAASSVSSRGEEEEDIGVALARELRRLVCTEGIELPHVFYSQLMLRNLGDFGAANAVYAKMLPQVNSPSRTCIQFSSSGFPRPPAVLADCFAFKGKRDVLHVQSVSSWAPACIGPYSQVSQFDGLLFLAGQIGLDPSTMLLVKEPLLQARQTLLNCERVLQVRDSSLVRSLVATVFTTPGYCSLGPELARKCGVAGDSVLYVEVAALPRGACVELQLICHQSPLDTEQRTATYRLHATPGPFKVVSRSLSSRGFVNYHLSLHAKEVKEASPQQPSPFQFALQQLVRVFVRLTSSVWPSLFIFRVYYVDSLSESLETTLQSLLRTQLGVAECPAISFIPVNALPFPSAASFVLLSLHALFLDLPQLTAEEEA